MFFRLTYSVKEFHITFSENKPLIIKSFGIHKALIVIKRPKKTEYPSGDEKTVICVATLEQDTKPEIQEMFLCLSTNKLPKGSTIPDKTSLVSRYIDEERKVKENFDIPLHYLPKPFRDYSDGIFRELSESIRRTALTIRWRYNLPDQPYNPFAEIKREWSFDGKKWFRMPYSWKVSVFDYSYVPQSSIKHEEVESLLESEVFESLGHELFREAWEQMHTNPRSSLVLGVASAETGFKNFVAELTPDSAWLISEIQSPPLKKMINDFLPLLPVKNSIGCKGVYFPRNSLETLEQGISQRNSIVHGKKTSIDIDELKNLLLTVQSFLWILDYYRGYDWAIDHVDVKMLEAWDS